MTNIILSDNHAKTVEFVNAEITKLSNKTAKFNEVYKIKAQLKTANRLASVLNENMSFPMTVINLMPQPGMEMDDFTAKVIRIFVGG